MTRGAWMCRQQDDGLKIWFAPRENEKPFTESERAQRWRLSLASLLFITVLLSDHLWFCAEAKLTRTRDKRSDRRLAFTDMGEYPTPPHHHHHHYHHRPSPAPHPPHRRRSRETDVIFIGNSTKPLWRLDTCQPDSLSTDCFTDAEPVCVGLSSSEAGDGTQLADVILSDLYLSFCNSYSLLDLFHGFTSPEGLNCSLAMVGDTRGCTECVRAYQSYDREAERDYQDFELLFQKYETDAYSVRTCMEECKMVYKPWLCSQYFRTSQSSCGGGGGGRIPCVQLCWEVQQRCPFILPDNDDLIHGGSPSFICTGLLEDYPSGIDPDAKCCDVDVRWDSAKSDNVSSGARRRTHPSCLHAPDSLGSPPPSSSACRLSCSRLRLCLLVLVLLHTVASLTAAHNATALGLPAISPLEESPASDE